MEAQYRQKGMADVDVESFGHLKADKASKKLRKMVQANVSVLQAVIVCILLFRFSFKFLPSVAEKQNQRSSLTFFISCFCFGRVTRDARIPQTG